MSNISISNLQPIGDESISVLSAEETESVSGGFIWIAAVVGGFLVGTGIRMGIDWLLE